MNLKRKLTLLLSLMVMGITAHATTVFAFKQITAREACDMVNSGQAKLVDVRTLEKCFWVGMPDVAGGGLYVIPFQTKTIAPDGTAARH